MPQLTVKQLQTVVEKLDSKVKTDLLVSMIGEVFEQEFFDDPESKILQIIDLLESMTSLDNLEVLLWPKE